MATKVRKLKDGEGNTIAPVTSTKAVINDTGQNVETLLDEKVGFKDAAGNPGIPKIPGGSISGVIDLSLMDIYGNYVGTRETANCYVITSPGDYKFPLIYGNAIKDGAKNTQAYESLSGQYQSDFVNMFNDPISSPYIEEDIDDIISSAEVLISDESDIISDLEIIDDFPCRFVKFHVSRIPEVGANAVIGVRNYGDSGSIAWSWHIWLWNQISHPLEAVEIKNHEGNSYNILNYNLGSKFDNDNVHLKNWLYQWGRKDPMLLPEAYNSNTNHTSYGSLSYSIENCASSVALAIKNPCTFYKYNNSYNYNWVQLNYYYNFWDATCNATGYTEKTVVKTVYDPCPRGFCVPNARVFTGFTVTGDYIEWGDNVDTEEEFMASINVNGSWANGWNFKTAAGGSVYFPASGYRSYGDGTLNDVGDYGYYWSAGAAYESYASRLNFYSGSVSPLFNSYRSFGFSVRPAAI